MLHLRVSGSTDIARKLRGEPAMLKGTLFTVSVLGFAAMGAVSAAADGLPSRARTTYAAGRCSGPFSGFYLGPQIGFGSLTSTWQEHATDSGNITDNNFYDRDVVAGGQVGYNCQTGMAVFG